MAMLLRMYSERRERRKKKEEEKKLIERCLDVCCISCLGERVGYLCDA
jgi:hypothetical protein